MALANTSPSLSPTPPSALKATLIALALSIFGLLFALILLEVGFRIFYFVAGQPKHWVDRPASYLMPEKSSTLQDRPYDPKKPKNTFRIAVVGDSFSFGPYLQFDDTFPKRLERWLNLNEKQPHVEVINYGVPRYSTTHEVDMVKRAISEQADLILLQITLNDPEVKPYRPTALLADATTGQLNLEKSWIHHLRSVQFILTRLYNWRSAREYRDYFFKLFRSKSAYGSFNSALKSIKQSSDSANVPVVAVVFPLFGLMVDQKYPFFKLHKTVRKCLKKLSIPALDLVENYRDIPIERLQVLPGVDRHPNEIGHRIAAEGILKWMRDENLVPAEILPQHQFPSRIGVDFSIPLP